MLPCEGRDRDPKQAEERSGQGVLPNGEIVQVSTPRPLGPWPDRGLGWEGKVLCGCASE